MVINFLLLSNRFLSNRCGRIFTLSQLNFLCAKTVKWLLIIFLFYNEIRMIFSLTIFLLFIQFLEFLFGFLSKFAMQEIKETIVILFFMFWKHIEIALQREWIRRGLSYQIEIIFQIIFYLNAGSQVLFFNIFLLKYFLNIGLRFRSLKSFHKKRYYERYGRFIIYLQDNKYIIQLLYYFTQFYNDIITFTCLFISIFQFFQINFAYLFYCLKNLQIKITLNNNNLPFETVKYNIFLIQNIMKDKIIVLVVLVVFIANSQKSNQLYTKLSLDPPIWPQQFTMPIYQRYSSNASQFTNGKVWVNYDKNFMRVDRNSSKKDGYCQAVLPNSTLPCTQLVNNGFKYVIFPSENICCKCCSILEPSCNYWKNDWLKNATFVQVKIIDWNQYYVWEQMMGNSKYLYTQSADEQRVPRQIAIQNQYYEIDFLGPFNTSYIPDSIFEIPSYCNKSCPKSSFCVNGSTNSNLLVDF